MNVQRANYVALTFFVDIWEAQLDSHSKWSEISSAETNTR